MRSVNYITEVTAGTFKLVGQRPILGRDFEPADETEGAASVAILSYGLWERRYGKAEAVIGQTVRINGVSTAVIGVMPQGFSFPQNQDVWVPLVPVVELRKRENRETWFVFGRLAEGVTVEGARAEIEAIGKRLESAYPVSNKGITPIVENFHEFFIGPNATMIYQAVWGAVGFVLLIACANLANLLLARAMARSREISVRMALGASRWRIIRQLLLESVMLSGLGGFFGWWTAKWGVSIYSLAATGAGLSDQISGVWFDHMLDYSMDHRVFVYLVAISVGTGFLFGLAPAARLSKLDVNAMLKDGGRGATGGGHRKRLSALLVIAEMALAVVLLAGAGVMVRSFLNLYTADLGFKASNIVIAQLGLPNSKYRGADERISFYDCLASRLEAIPGVESVAITSALPARGSIRVPFELDGAPPGVYRQENERLRPKLSKLVVSPAYFRTLGGVVLSGRDFNEGDGPSGVPVVIVNQRLASTYWPGENTLGKRLRLVNGSATGAWLSVVGVTANIAQNDVLRPELNSVVYLPYRQAPAGNMYVVTRTRLPLGGFATILRSEIRSIDSILPIGLGPFSLAQQLAEKYQYRGVSGAMFLICAAIALLLASVGLYAVIAHSVSQRTQEIGVRMALGAASSDVLKLVFQQGMLQVGIGLAIGLAASLAVNRVLQAQLVQVSPSDPITLAVVSAASILAGTLGCWLPAWRAMRVDPVVALRHE